MERIQKKHCRPLPYNLTELCSDQKFYLGFEGGETDILKLLNYPVFNADIYAFQSRDLVECDVLKEPQSGKTDVLLRLIKGL